MKPSQRATSISIRLSSETGFTCFSRQTKSNGVHGSHLRYERLPAASDTEGDGQVSILDMLYAHHKMPRQEALRLNPSVWKQTRLRNAESLTLGELHREFTANPGQGNDPEPRYV